MSPDRVLRVGTRSSRLALWQTDTVIARLQARFAFYIWNHEQNVVRWMTSFATTEAEVEAFAAAVREEALAG